MGRIGQIAWNKGKKGLQIPWNKGMKFPEFCGDWITIFQKQKECV